MTDAHYTSSVLVSQIVDLRREIERLTAEVARWRIRWAVAHYGSPCPPIIMTGIPPCRCQACAECDSILAEAGM